MPRKRLYDEPLVRRTYAFRPDQLAEVEDLAHETAVGSPDLMREVVDLGLLVKRQRVRRRQPSEQDRESA